MACKSVKVVGFGTRVGTRRSWQAMGLKGHGLTNYTSRIYFSTSNFNYARHTQA